MSLSVDDLVSSLSSSHIGQEAIELAALQEYLRQTGFGRPQADPSSSSMNMKTPRRRTSYAQLSNTPTVQTPLSTPSGWGGYEAKVGAASAMEEEDEAMVEDLLMPPPSSPGPMQTQSAFHHPQSQYDYPQNQTHNSTSRSTSRSRSTSSAHYGRPQHSSAGDTSSSSSIFTSSDPFYLAQLQQASQPRTQPSAFAVQSSPFTAQPSPFYTQQHPHHYQTPQCMLVDMAPAYGR